MQFRLSFLFLATASAAVAASPAAARDDDNWTGLYAGVHVGMSQAQSESDVTLGGNWSTRTQGERTFVASNAAADIKDDNVNLGLQLGYNYQAGSFVIGAEAEFASFEKDHAETRGPLRETSSSTTTYTFTNTLEPESSVSLKGKLGLATGSTLFYATGGWAWTKVEFGTGITSSANYRKLGTLEKTMDGFTVGAGIEQRLTRNLSARLSYDYADQGSVEYATAYQTGSALTTPAFTETVRQDLNLHFVRVGVNYRF